MDLGIACRICMCITMIMKYSDSRTFKVLLHQIPKLSSHYSVFTDFPGPGKMTNFSRTFKAV